MKYNKSEIAKFIQDKDPSIEFIKPQQTARSSPFWSSFSQVFYKKVKQDVIKCNTCESILIHKSIDGTRVMSNHIKACKEKKQLDINQDNANVNRQSKDLIQSYVKKLITDACVEFTFLDNRPFETVNGDGFVKLIENVFAAGQQLAGSLAVQAKDLIPNPTTISRNIDQVYKLRKGQLVKWCRSIDFHCITVDFWTESHTGIHFGGVSLHHIDKDNRLYVFILGCYPYDECDQKSPSIRIFVEKILAEYGLKLEDETYVMTDNENKMKCAFDSKCKRIGCSSHYLNKQMEHAFTSETIDKQPVDCAAVQELFKHIKSLVAHIRRSHKQLKLSRKLQSYSDTRFNGAFYMLEVFLFVFDELFPIINSNHLDQYIKIDKNFLQEVCNFLEPFDQVFKELSDTDRPTLHRVIPLRQYLLNRCEIKSDDHHGIKKLKRFLKERIENSWILADEHYLATILHPKLKHFQTGSTVDKEKAVSLLKMAIKNRVESESISSSNISHSHSSNQSSPKYSTYNKGVKTSEGNNLLARCFDQPSNRLPSYLRECDEYLNSTVYDKDDDDILVYWKKHQDQFPNIYSLARQVLSIPASNTEVERLFSCSKMVMTDKRTRLDPDKLNKLIFLRKNIFALKQLNESTYGRKRKSINESEFDDKDECEQTVLSISKKHRSNNEDSEAELEE